MTKHCSHKKRCRSHKSKTIRRRRSQHGGDLGGNPASAWGWGLGTLGNGWQQFTNALTLQPGQNLGTVQSNNIVPIGRINAQDAQGMIGPNMKGNIPGQSGGRKRRSKRGGNVFAQAAVPVALIAMNNMMGSRKRGRKSK